DRARLRDLGGDRRRRVRADFEPQPAFRDLVIGDDFRVGIRLERGSRDDVARQLDREAERTATAQLLGHLPADQDRVRLATEVAEYAELVLDLRAAGDEHERPFDLAEELSQFLELAPQQ